MSRLLRLGRIVILLALGSVGWATTTDAQTCLDCRPPQVWTPNWHGTLDVCFETGGGETIPWTPESYMQSGINSYMGNWFQGNEVPIAFSYRESSDEGGCQGADVRIRVDPNLAGTSTAGQGSPTYGITINPDRLTDDYDSLAHLAAHEMMHVLGFDHVPQNCENGYSIMPRYYNGTAWPPGLLCGDASRMSMAYLSTSGGYDGQDQWVPSGNPDASYEDCWDVYGVYVAQWYDAEGDLREEETYYLRFWSCDTPPI